MVNLTINSIPVTVPEGTTILDAAASVDIEIPSLCYLKELNEISACRVCCVEVEGEGKLVPSCNNVVREGMVIRTNSPRALEARRVNMELILSQHDNKCATCIRSGTCQLQKIANDMGILGVSYPTDLARGKKADWTTTFPLYRDVNKCIKCMRCIQVCDKVQSLSVWDISGSGARTTIDVSGNRVIKQADCSLCGQCITHCPTGALRERDDTQKAYAALGDPDRVTIVQIAPAVRAAWGEAFGMPTGKATVGQLVSVLRKLGADYVFDTTFSADLTIMEEGTELLQRLQAGDLDNQPMFTSCCPGWVRFLKSQFPEMTGRLSTAKSPQQMFGAVGKTWLAHNLGVDADKIYSISIMPCIAKRPSASCRAWIRPVTAAMSIWSSPPESWRAWRVPSTSMWKTSRNPRLILRWATAPAQALFSARPAALWRPRCVRRTSSPPAKIRRRMHSARCVTTARFLRCRGAKRRSSWQAGLCAAR